MAEHIAISASAVESDPFNAASLEAFRSIGCNQTVMAYSLVPECIERLEAADSITIMGTPLHYSKKTAEVLAYYFQGMEDAKLKKVLGNCAGMQALALVFGGKMNRDEKLEVGPTEVETIKGRENNLILNGLGRTFMIDNLHRASIDLSDAPDIECVARSANCEVQIMEVLGQYGYVFGAQGHPENGWHGLKLLRNFLDLPEKITPLLGIANDTSFKQTSSGLVLPNGQKHDPPDSLVIAT